MRSTPEFYRLPSGNPQLNAIERFWKRRRATHNRLFESLAELKRWIRASIDYYLMVRGRSRSLIAPATRETGHNQLARE